MSVRSGFLNHLFFAICFILIFGLLTCEAAADELVTLKAEAGFNGCSRSGQAFPVQVTVENQGPEIKGTLEFSTTYNGSRILHKKEVQLPRGSKKRVSMYIPANEATNYTLDLMGGGKKIASTKVRITILQPQEVLVGVLASNPATLNHLNAIKLPAEGQRISVFSLRAEDIPENSLLLESIDLIALNDFPTSQLSSRQLAAIQAWVERGGTMVMAGGPNWQKTLSALPAAMLPVQVSGSRTLGGISGSGKLAALNWPAGPAFIASEAKITSGQALLLEGSLPLIVQKEKGKGKLVYMAFDLAMQPFANWTGNADLWTELLTRFDPHHMISTGSARVMNQRQYQPQEMTWVLRNIPSSGLPSAATLTLVLLAYVLLLGPGIYLLLKKYDRRDWGWLAIPLLAVLMFSFTYWGVFKAKGRDVFTNVVSLLRIEQDSDYSRLTSYIGIFAPTKSNYTLALPAGEMVDVLPSNDSAMTRKMSLMMANNPSAVKTPALATVVQGENPQVLYTDSSRWSMRCILSEESIRQSGKIQSDLQSKQDGISGRISNQSGHTLTDCLVFNRYGYQRIARLGPGETAQINISLRFSPSQGPAFNRIFERYPIHRPQELNRAYNRDTQINRQLMETLSNNSDVFNEPLIFMGHSAEPAGEKAIGQDRGEKYYNTIVVSNLKLNFDQQKQVEIPPGIINGSLTASDGRNLFQDSWGYSVDSGSVSFNLELPYPASELDPRELKIYIGSNDYRRAGLMKIKIYNQALARWEDFTYQSTGIPLQPAKSYISGDGLIKVTIATPEDKGNTNINVSNVTLSLKGSLLKELKSGMGLPDSGKSSGGGE
ncbi:MAG: hypothetical protein PHX14_09045 [Syntrophomonadaceae bacterium]|nr:hypothetical protein [Syntrophomonadaceae bacterium]